MVEPEVDAGPAYPGLGVITELNRYACGREYLVGIGKSAEDIGAGGLGFLNYR